MDTSPTRWRDRPIAHVEWERLESALSKKQHDALDKSGREEFRNKVERAMAAHQHRVSSKPAPRAGTIREIEGLWRHAETLLCGLTERLSPEAKAALAVSSEAGFFRDSAACVKKLSASFERAKRCVPAGNKPSHRMRALIQDLDVILLKMTGQRVTRSGNSRGSSEFARLVARLVNVENASIEEAIRYVARARRK